MYLMWSQFVTNSEFSCLAKLAKPYPVSGPTYLRQIPNQPHCISSGAHDALITIFGSTLMSVFTLKRIASFA